MFVQSAKFVQEYGGRIGDIAIYGQESNCTTWRLAKRTNCANRPAKQSSTSPTSVTHGAVTDAMHCALAKTSLDFANPPRWKTSAPGRYVGVAKQKDDGEPFDEKMTQLTAQLAKQFAERAKHERKDGKPSFLR